jgi:methionyl-tRNA formyltransferase
VELTMRIVFMGTPAAAVPSLQALISGGHEIAAVWTQPDKPSGRGHKVTPSPVKELAISQGLTVHQPARIKTAESISLFTSHKAELVVVVAYGRILPSEFLNAPTKGCINVHFSLLPQYRGAAPVNWAIINGESRTGVTTMFIEEELDAGPILLQRETSIGPSEVAPELMARLSHAGADLLRETVDQLDTIPPRPQQHRDASFAPLLRKENGLIDWTLSARMIECRVRGLQPWPNAYTHYNGERVIVWRAEVIEDAHRAGAPGEVLAAHGDNLIVKCGAGTDLRLTEVQLEGKRRMSVRNFLNGTHLKVGERFESA